jgi:hypothetical protein
MRNGIAYRLPPLVPRISGTGYSFWRTPTPTEAGNDVAILTTKDGGPAEIGKRAYRPDGSLQGQTLSQQVRFPTPRSTDGDKGTRTAEGAAKELERGKNVDLGVFVKMWPTMTVVSAEHPGQVKRKDGQQTCLSMEVNQVDGTSGALNPQWVEWLMGFPIEWTDCEDSETQ